ncbi:MAG: hypothetical protein RSF82_09285 [Angelakisella sp.]
MEMLDLMLFDIKEDCIAARGGCFYFYSILPPNFSTLDEPERELYYMQFEKLMRATTEHSFFICALDKTVSLSQNRDYIMSLDDRYDDIKEALLGDLAQMENDEGNTQRSYYFGTFCRQPGEALRFETILRSMGTNIIPAGRPELMLIMRCFNLREFVDCDILVDPGEEPTVYGKKKTVVSPVVKHLLPTTLSFDNNLDMVVQTNFVRKALVVRNLPQRIDRHNRDMFKKLLQLSNTTVMLRISDMNYSETKDLVNKQFSNSSANLMRSKIADVIEAEVDARTIQDFYRNIQESAADGGGMKRVNIFVETYGKDKSELDKNVRRVRTSCETYGMTLEDFVLHQEDGFFGVSPIGYDTRGRLLANNIPSNTFGRLYPFSSSYINDCMGMILGRTVDNGMVSLDVWVRTIFRTNSNIAIIGDSGMGKSYLIKKIIALQRLLGTKMWILDSENEYSPEVLQLGGKVINCVIGEFAINALQIRVFRTALDDEPLPDEEDGQTATNVEMPSAFADEQPFYQHLSWLKDFIKVLLPDITALQTAAFCKIVRDIYHKFGINENTDLGKLDNNDYPLFSDVYTYIDDVLKNPAKYPFYTMIEQSDLRALLLLLDDVCYGSLSPQFNRHTNAADSDLVNLNIQGLLMGDQNSMQAVLFNYLTYIWGKVSERRGKVMLIVDELYLLANEDNPVILKYFNAFERRSRKYLACLLIGTQKVMDCLNPKISQWTSAIFDTPTYKFMFHPGDVDLEVLKAKLRLTQGEATSISLPEKKNCLLKVGKEKYHMKVGTLPYEAKLFGKGGGL